MSIGSFRYFGILVEDIISKKGRSLLFLLQTPIKSRFRTIKQGRYLTLPMKNKGKRNEKQNCKGTSCYYGTTIINYTFTIIRETHIKNMYWKPHILTG